MRLLATLALLGTGVLLTSIPSHATSLDNALGIYLGVDPLDRRKLRKDPLFSLG